MYLTSNYFDIKNYDQPSNTKLKKNKTFESEHTSARTGMLN